MAYNFAFTSSLLFVLVNCFLHLGEGRAAPKNLGSISDDLYNMPMSRTIQNKKLPLKIEAQSLLQPVPEPRYVKTGQICEGACISPRACDYHGGTPRGYCVTGSICCKFERSCRGVSKEKISFFQSPEYPSALNQSMECSYHVYPNEDVCAIRVDFQQLDAHKAIKYPRTEKCIVDSFYILNTLNGVNEALCEMGNYSSILSVDPKSSKPVILLFVMQSAEYKWKLKLTQINCKKLKPWKNVPDCGRQLMYEPNDENPGQVNSWEDYHHSLSPPPLSPYIVHGKDAESREFPWQISLQLTPKHVCGGSILNERYILTAAHCVMGRAYKSIEKMRVVVGDLILNTTVDGQHEDLEVESVIVNFHYKTFESYINDIAIIKVKTSITFSPTIQPVCLPPQEFQTENKEALVSGWGRLNGTTTSTDAKAYHLQKLNVKIISDAECREAVRQEVSKLVKKNLTASETPKYAQLGYSKSQICGLAKLNSTVCFGDSGGPLVVQNEEDGRYFQVGVVSYGLGQCVVSRVTPVAYTRVSEYLNFIAMATAE